MSFCWVFRAAAHIFWGFMRYGTGKVTKCTFLFMTYPVRAHIRQRYVRAAESFKIVVGIRELGGKTGGFGIGPNLKRCVIFEYF